MCLVFKSCSLSVLCSLLCSSVTQKQCGMTISMQYIAIGMLYSTATLVPQVCRDVAVIYIEIYLKHLSAIDGCADVWWVHHCSRHNSRFDFASAAVIYCFRGTYCSIEGRNKAAARRHHLISWGYHMLPSNCNENQCNVYNRKIMQRYNYSLVFAGPTKLISVPTPHC